MWLSQIHHCEAFLDYSRDAWLVQDFKISRYNPHQLVKEEKPYDDINSGKKNIWQHLTHIHDLKKIKHLSKLGTERGSPSTGSTTRVKEIKLYLFADDMIVYTENRKESTNSKQAL